MYRFQIWHFLFTLPCPALSALAVQYLLNTMDNDSATNKMGLSCRHKKIIPGYFGGCNPGNWLFHLFHQKTHVFLTVGPFFYDFSPDIPTV